MSMPNINQLFNFVQGSDITGESSYDIWKKIHKDDDPSEIAFLEFLRGGPKGDPGLSAYEQWCTLEGNEEKTFDDFLNFIKGSPGVRGPAGKSVYETWLEIEGNSGKTRKEFFEDLGRVAVDGSINASKLEMIEYTDSKVGDSLNTSKSYTDNQISLEKEERKEADNNIRSEITQYINSEVTKALDDAKAYTDEKIDLNEEESSKLILSESKAYTDEQIGIEVENRNTAISLTKEEVIKYVDNEIEGTLNTIDENITQKIESEVVDRNTAIDNVRTELL